ncbi:MAG: NACHT domain-containing protein, partial [Cyanobacteria bacterium P01_E01_bin.42]
MREIAIVLPPQQRLLAFVVFCLLIVVSSSLGAFFLAPLWGLWLPLPLLVVGWFFRRMFIPGITGQTKVQLASLATLYATSVLYFLPSNPLTAIAIAVLNRWLHLELGDPLWYSLVAQSFVCLTIVSLNIAWRSRDISPVPQGAKDILPDSDRADFDRSLERYCTALVAELDRYDRDVNWSDRDLTPLEAEVETERNSRMRPRIVKDLVAAIRRDRFSETFVVLGDPGSGKSVSLRRLVRELCQQAKTTGVVPVYVNLREYPPNRQLTTEGLVEFIKEEAYRQTGRDGRSFLDTWYDQFRKNSQLFFVIDSFDELPSVLDCDDRSDAHKRTSAAFDRFFTQEIQSCRAVLSSRHFRAPVGVKGTRLMLRPFRESQIRQAMKTWLLGRRIDTDGYIRRLFREKPELVPALRNPFTAELISEYARSAGEEELPENLFAVFNHYIENRLAADRPKLRELNLTGEEVRKCAAMIAEKMYRSGTFGLEAEVKWVVEEALGEMGRDRAENIIEALRYSRIVRVGGRINPRFSFVHRRFAEFFVVEAIRETENDFLNVEAIPTDSRWRDCLVMYCGIAELSVRRNIAEYCWSVIEKSKSKFLSGDFNNSRDVVHCLRFLTDAFRSDFLALQDFQIKLFPLIYEALHSQDTLIAKISSEAIPLLDLEIQQELIILAFESESAWVCETTLGSCRNLSTIHYKTKRSIQEYLKNIPLINLIKRFRELDFSMSVSDTFQDIRLFLYFDLIEIIISFGSFTAINLTCIIFFLLKKEGIFLIIYAVFSLAFSVSTTWIQYKFKNSRAFIDVFLINYNTISFFCWFTLFLIYLN